MATTDTIKITQGDTYTKVIFDIKDAGFAQVWEQMDILKNYDVANISLVITAVGSTVATNTIDCDISTLVERLDKQVSLIDQIIVDHDARISVNAEAENALVQHDVLAVFYDAEKDINYVTTTREPLGDIISIIVDFSGESLVVDGKYNQADTRIEFLSGEDLNGRIADVKYLRVK